MIKIYTFAHKRPDFLELQLRSFKKNLADDFEFIVFDNAVFDPSPTHHDIIHGWCRQNNVRCIDIIRDQAFVNAIQRQYGETIFGWDNQYTNAGIACAYPLCWAWNEIISKTNDMICIIDSDMFFVDKENISDTLSKYDVVYMPQSRGPNGEIRYMWNGISYMNLDKMPEKPLLNWWCGSCDGHPVDVGGHTHYYLQKYRDSLKLLEFTLHYIRDDTSCDFHPANYEYFTTNESKTLLHYRGGSNWDQKPQEYHTKKTAWLKAKLGL